MNQPQQPQPTIESLSADIKYANVLIETLTKQREVANNQIAESTARSQMMQTQFNAWVGIIKKNDLGDMFGVKFADEEEMLDPSLLADESEEDVVETE